ncbi:MAG: glycoside hydrolase family 2 protein [Clostridia bacterium]|nr:glycoside hydrolase family 2 protein [Clostridia bacterium]
MRKIISLNRKWSFRKGVNEVPAVTPVDWDFVNVPHCWNAIDGQDGGNDYFRGTCCYVKDIDREEIPTADKYYLEINGANSSATVYMNGEKLASHDGGYSTWRVDITEALKKGTRLGILVDNSANETVYPQMADFTFYGGLYRDVNLIAVSESHFELDYYGGRGIAITPKVVGTDAQVTFESFVTNKKPGQMINYIIKDKLGDVVTTLKTDEAVETIEIKNVVLWNGRKNPYLYTAEIELLDGDKVIDKVSTRFGCRTFEIDPERGFILNGEEYPLRGVSRHQDRWGFGNALLPEHHKEDMELIYEMGANTIRLAHYQHDQYFYDLCDEYGMVIWAEIPYISKHMPTGRENTISQMKELIVQNYNHPSIVVWGLSNEISMNGSDDDLIENHKILNDLCHEMDKTRLTTIAVVSMCSLDDPYIQIPDVVSHNHYFGWYGGDTSMNGPWFDNFHAKFPNIPVGMSEYGCEALNWHTSNPQQGDYTEGYQAYYHEELIKQLFSRKYIWATHVWNMFDFGADARQEGGENGQNHKGLMTFDRKYKKDAFYAYKAWLSDDPFVHICGKRYVDRVEDLTKITVYSNLPEVELIANGKSLGRQASDNHFFYFDVPNTASVTHLQAVAGEYGDQSLIRKVETFNEDYRLKEKGAVLNWFDVTEVDGYLSLNSKMSELLMVKEGQMLFGQIMGPIAEAAKQSAGEGGFEMNEGMMQMMGGFTVLRLIGMLGMTGLKMNKEELLDLNAKLNKIKKA